MTETEKDIALLRHEANRLRLFGRHTSSKVLADKADALERLDASTNGLPFEPSYALRWVAQFILSNPVKFVELVMFGSKLPDGVMPSSVVQAMAQKVAFAPDTASRQEWGFVLALLNGNKPEFAMTLPVVNNVDFVISFIEGLRDAAQVKVAY
ncbi:MAG: hypothetical protein ACRC8R_12155 [Aeromonas hydrophila]